MAIPPENAQTAGAVEPFDVGRLRSSRVVGPVHDVLALAEIVGARVFVLDPRGDHRTMSTAWVRAHRPAPNAEDLARQLGEAPRPPTSLDELCAFRPFDGSMEEFGERLVRAAATDV